MSRVPHIEPIKPLNPYPALRAWHCENSHLDAKPEAPAIVDRRWVLPWCGPIFFSNAEFPVKRKRFFGVLKCGRKWLFTTCLLMFLDQDGASCYILKAFSEIWVSLYQYRICHVPWYKYLLENPWCFYIAVLLLCATHHFLRFGSPSAVATTGTFPATKFPFGWSSAWVWKWMPWASFTIMDPQMSVSQGIFWNSLPRFGFISKIHSSSSSTTFACDEDKVIKKTMSNLQFSHDTELCGVAKRW